MPERYAIDTPPIFVIDDEEPVRAGLARLLRSLGMPSLTFESAESFLNAGPRRAALELGLRA
jgi:FixJ family two-component response regulator